jgi:hypothetical protein
LMNSSDAQLRNSLRLTFGSFNVLKSQPETSVRDFASQLDASLTLPVEITGLHFGTVPVVQNTRKKVGC